MGRESKFGSGCWLVAGWVLMAPLPVQAEVLGMVGDDAADRAVVFDAQTGTILGAVNVGPGSVGDCAITADQSLGLMVDLASRLWLVDLERSPPTLATGINPIVLSNLGQDVDLSADGRYALVCGGTSVVSVVDLATRAEADTFDLGHGCQSVAVCDDGSVLVGWISIPDGQLVRRLLLDAMGQLTDSGDSFVPDFPTNVHCAPGAESALILQLGWDVTSVSVSGMASLDQVTLSGAASTAVFHQGQDRISIRAEDAIEAYSYDATTGSLSDMPVLTIPNTGSFVPLGGIDTLALDSTSGLLYAPDDEEVKIYNASTGAPLTPISDLGSDFTGICLGDGSLVFTDGFESGDTSAWSAPGFEPARSVSHPVSDSVNLHHGGNQRR